MPRIVNRVPALRRSAGPPRLPNSPQRLSRELAARPVAGIWLRWVVLLIAVGAQPLAGAAAPPVIRPRPHPLDPDWPLVKWIMDRKCAGCHRPGTERADLSSHEALVDPAAELIDPADPERSELWQYVAWNVGSDKYLDRPSSPEMPPEKHAWLTAGQLDTLARWIARGGRKFREGCGPERPLMEIDFPSAKQCQTCHPRQYAQWSQSMHAYAQHSPVFEAFNLTLIERTGGTIGTFCSRCHTPLGTALGENGSVRNVHRSRLSMEGVSCVVCHRRSKGFYKSNGRFEIHSGDLDASCMMGPFETSLPANQGLHPAGKLPYIQTAQFCGECHDVTSPAGVRLEEAFSEWNHSPAAKQGIRCQQCHMGPVQGVPIADCDRPRGRVAVVPGLPADAFPIRTLSDHTFAGPDYSLLPDTEFPEKLDWMYEVDYRREELLTPYQQRTLRELRFANRRANNRYLAKRAELMRNSVKLRVEPPAHPRPGRAASFSVALESTTAGHNVPTGFTAERQLWVSLEIRDPRGRVVFVTGDLDARGDLRDAHSFEVLAGRAPVDPHLLNLQSKFVSLANKGTERSVVLSVNRDLQPLNVFRPAVGLSASMGRPNTFRLAKGSLPPLEVFRKTYRFVPASPGRYQARAQVNFRHLPPSLLDHIGIPELSHLLDVLVLDDWQGTFVVR